MPDSCQKLIHHLSRIQGQIDGLKVQIEQTQDCEKVTQLASAVIKSFDSFRAKLVESLIEQKVGKIKNEDDLAAIIKLIKA